MIIMGIDPGIAIVGYGVLEYKSNRFSVIDYGAVTTKAGEKLSDRLRDIYESINILIERFSPDAFAIEELFFNTNVKTAITVAHGRGVAMLAASSQNLPIFEYTPLQVKQAVSGYGRADKQQIQRMVKSLLCLDSVPKPDDVADALAVAICHAHTAKYSRMIKDKGV
ncbi:MAG: crossover junction endodeoxyribonuclease RuvC [Ruminococcaceae bacterium]|nr:crossover junction endodeoxyribonuclease RuvC [Oscillospiraceae bacterium]